jgi:hypothetical protein
MMWRRPILIAGVFALVYPALTWGTVFSIVPSISVKEEYNDNIMLSEDDIKEDFISTISPGVGITDLTERLNANIQLRINRIDYAYNRELSSTDQAYSGKLKYLITPLFGMSTEAAYVRDSRPDRDIETSGVVLSDEIRHRITSSLSADYQLTEKTAAGASYSYNRSDFESQSDLDDTAHDTNIGLVYNLGAYVPTLQGRTNAGYSYYDTQDSRIKNVIWTIGLSRDIDEVWGVLLNGGIRRTWSDLSVVREEPVFDHSVYIGNRAVKEHVKNADWGWVGQASLNYKGERGSGSFSYSRGVQPASGLGGAVEHNALTLSTRYRLTTELSLLLTAEYYSNKSDASEFSAQDIDQRGLHIRPGGRYEFSKDMAVEAFYDYTTDDNKVSNAEAQRHLLSVRLYAQHSFFN